MADPRVRDLGEDRLIARLLRRVPGARPGETGAGDDAALLPVRGRAVLTTDALHEETHFRRRWCLPEELGWKALAVNLSDLAAMGARPRSVLVSLAVPGDLRVSALERLYAGMGRLARRARVTVLGGNLARADRLAVTLTAVGDLGDHKPFLRKGIRPGDRLFVSGHPGRAALGLGLLTGSASTGPDPWSMPAAEAKERRARRLRDLPGAAGALRAWLRPDPRLELARALRRITPRAVIDVSDGLARDLPRLAGEAVDLVVGDLPQDAADVALAGRLGLDPFEAVLQGGEDYELLVALPPRTAERLDGRRFGGGPFREIGHAVAGRGRVWVERDGTRKRLGPGGFDHFLGDG